MAMDDTLTHRSHSLGTSELTQWLFGTAVAALAIWLVLLVQRKFFQPQTKKEPPGPWALPLVGTLGISNTASLFRKSVEWAKLYGPIFRVRIGTANVVILNDMEHIKKFYSSKEGVIRPTNAIIDELRHGATIVTGVSNLNGKAWTQNRNFSLRVFGDLGFGHPSMEDHIMEELQDLVSQISDNAGGFINLKGYVIASVANVIAALLFGRRFNWGDDKHDFLVKHLRNVLDGFESGLVVENKPNWLSTITASLPISKPGVMRRSRILLQEFVRDQIREHKNTLPQDFNRDFIDGYLKKTMEQQSKTESYFDERHLLGNISEFLVTGTGPASMRIFWMLHICAQNPDSVQSRIQKEIDDVIGRQRQPKWEDRQAMPFTMATLKETMRWKTLRPIGGSRGIQENTFIGDYFIPKGTIVLLNSRTVHRNPDYWNNPDEFDPTRFLTSDGTELVKNEESFLAFGAGRRNCLGQNLGYVQLFLYITTLLQKFSVFPEDGHQAPDIGSLDTTTDDPRLQKLRFVLR
ncbi:cytochrome P450 2H2 [Ixodes scapularis]